MPEYTANAIQTIPIGENVIFTDTAIPCTKGFVIHREGSGVFTLRGFVNNCNGTKAVYKVSFGANAALPTGEDVAPVQLTFTLNGEPISYTTMIDSSAIAENYFNVARSILVEVPRGCCTTFAVRNTSTVAANVQDANLIIEKIA